MPASSQASPTSVMRRTPPRSQSRRSSPRRSTVDAVLQLLEAREGTFLELGARSDHRQRVARPAGIEGQRSPKYFREMFQSPMFRSQSSMRFE